jgi:hypothetical protein
MMKLFHSPSILTDNFLHIHLKFYIPISSVFEVENFWDITHTHTHTSKIFFPPHVLSSSRERDHISYWYKTSANLFIYLFQSIISEIGRNDNTYWIEKLK